MNLNTERYGMMEKANRSDSDPRVDNEDLNFLFLL